MCTAEAIVAVAGTAGVAVSATVAEIADARVYLRSGNALPEDHVLLEHELTELKYLRTIDRTKPR